MHGKSKQTISRVHQNVANYHGALAVEAWDVYTHCLDDRGLLHPDFVPTMKKSLYEYWRHASVADALMRLRPMGHVFGQPRRVNTRRFADEFEKALEQRGLQAKEAANK